MGHQAVQVCIPMSVLESMPTMDPKKTRISPHTYICNTYIKMHKMTHIHMRNTKQSAGLCVAKVLPQVEIIL